MCDYICPKCKAALHKDGGSLICPNGHCFDISKKGYVNLLLSSARGHHGDDKLMVRSRKEFLDKGFYDPLSAVVAKCAGDYCAGEEPIIIDAGCGEGKYTADVLNAMSRIGKKPIVYGIDISKEALIYAAKRSKALNLAVASSAALPFADSMGDMILNIFSPLIPGEFKRVLKPGGILIRVCPMEKHLWELKELIYSLPYENPPVDTAVEGFTLIAQIPVKYNIELKSKDEIMSLFKMTPYYYKTSAADQQKAEAAESLTTRLEFSVMVYAKN